MSSESLQRLLAQRFALRDYDEYAGRTRQDQNVEALDVLIAARHGELDAREAQIADEMCDLLEAATAIQNAAHRLQSSQLLADKPPARPEQPPPGFYYKVCAVVGHRFYSIIDGVTEFRQGALLDSCNVGGEHGPVSSEFVVYGSPALAIKASLNPKKPTRLPMAPRALMCVKSAGEHEYLSRGVRAPRPMETAAAEADPAGDAAAVLPPQPAKRPLLIDATMAAEKFTPVEFRRL